MTCIETKEITHGRLAFITTDGGRTLDWGLYSRFQETIPLKEGDVVSVFDNSGELLENAILSFKEEQIFLGGNAIRRVLTFNNIEQWKAFFSTNKYASVVRLTDELELYERD